MSESVEERIVHRHRRATVRIQQLYVPQIEDYPALAIERTTLAKGAVGPCVILVHGFAQNRYSWTLSERSLSTYFAAAGFEVLNLELRGHGNSRVYGSKSPRAFSEYVDDLSRVALACEHPPFVIGHSLGAAVGVGASTRADLAGLIHLAGVYQFGRDNLFLNGTGRATTRLNRPLGAIPFRMWTGWIGELAAPMVKGVDLAMHFLPFAGWVPGSVEHHLIQERIRKGFDWVSVEIWLEMASWTKEGRFPYQSAFRETDVPLFVIAGDQDRLLSVEEAFACFDESGSTDKTFRLYEKSVHGMHWGHLDLVLGKHAPEVVWPDMLAWMRDRA